MAPHRALRWLNLIVALIWAAFSILIFPPLLTGDNRPPTWLILLVLTYYGLNIAVLGLTFLLLGNATHRRNPRVPLIGNWVLIGCYAVLETLLISRSSSYQGQVVGASIIMLLLVFLSWKNILALRSIGPQTPLSSTQLKS